MNENNKTLGLTLKKTTLRVLNVDELHLVGGADDDTGRPGKTTIYIPTRIEVNPDV